MKDRSAEQRLGSIKRFSDAGVSMGKVHVERAYKEFDESGESGYSEGWAAGFAKAMEIINEYVSREVEELKAEGGMPEEKREFSVGKIAIYSEVK